MFEILLGSDSFNLSGFSDDDFDLRICTGGTKEDSPNRNKSPAEESPEKTPVKEYPGMFISIEKNCTDKSFSFEKNYFF